MEKKSEKQYEERRKRVMVSISPDAEPELCEWVFGKARPATYLKTLAIMDMARNGGRA